MQRANKSRKNEKLISKINKFFTLESTKRNIIHEAPPISVKDIFKHFWPYTPQKCLKYGLSQHLHLSSPYVLQKETAGKILVREGEIITMSHPNLIRGYELHSKPQPVVIQETLTGKTISHLVRQIYKRGDELSLI
ncbi:hypothetical protein [Salinicoccus halodurans]|uniref:hypothetical protein n=1 Tax=Salinicoccus halodurans TaxID=407035 RepID=UPI00069A4B4E|nr:hypothetical protein [Salinicoccus halodurans]